MGNLMTRRTSAKPLFEPTVAKFDIAIHFIMWCEKSVLLEQLLMSGKVVALKVPGKGT